MSKTMLSEEGPVIHYLNGELIRRMAGFLSPYRRLIIIAVLLIPLCIGLELSLPVVTRTAIDRYLVPYHLHVQTGSLEFSLCNELQQALQETGNHRDTTGRFIPEHVWRGFDPALVSSLRAADVIGDERYYAASSSPQNEAIANRYPLLFQHSGNSLLIAEDDLEGLDTEEKKLLRRNDMYGLIGMAGLFSILASFLLAVSYLQTVYLERAGQLMMKDVRSVLFHHILTRSQFFFGDHSVGKLVTRLNNDVQSMAELFRQMVAGLFQDVFLFCGIAVVMFALNARLAAVCMLVVPPMAVLALFFARVSKKISHRLKACTGKVNSGLQETITGMDTIRLLGARAIIMEKLTRTNHHYFQAGIGQTKMFALFTPLMELLGSLALALIIWYGGSSVIQDRLSLGTLVAFLTYIQMLLVPIRGMSEKYNQLQGALASTERIFSLLDDPRTLVPIKEHHDQISADKTDITFDSVDFGYRPGQKILDRFNLVIPEGQNVTIVGPSGGGKTTLVNLLLRLYDPQHGKIRLGSTALETISPEERVKKIALVSQEMILLAADIEQNIILGRRWITHSMLDRAVRVSGIDTWLETLPHGIHTRVGEGGRQLSFGQCQMLALARALAGDPRILILDEAFSQIDPESEQLIQERLPLVMAGRTCITVAHALATARHSQRIMVVRDGRIVEEGDHQSLMNARGTYADMVNLENCRS